MSDASTEPATVQLLGGFRLLCGDHEVVLNEGAQRLVSLLALRGRVPRGRVIGLLWPDVDEDRALARLRTGIWRVNQAAPGLVSAQHGSIDLGAHAYVDVRATTRLALAVLSGEDEPIDVAVGSFEGELLPHWDDDWLILDRERIRQLRLHLYECLARRMADKGQYGLAVEMALMAVCGDVARESAHQTLISVHLAEGNMSEARRAFDNCRRVLIDELGVEPASTTVELLGPKWVPRPRTGLS